VDLALLGLVIAAWPAARLFGEPVFGWLAEQGVTAVFIEKGSPQQNAFVERFNGTMRDELLNGEQFVNLLEAQVVVGSWRAEYNQQRPHRGLGMLTPAAFAGTWTEGRK